ncbi:MAG TPA: alpha/beta hydrolase [Candidatus Pelethocola excrementipullorum]|nr:alpha/beta hydrolase [Candidatus Pelethocola excrementipullorum]
MKKTYRNGLGIILSLILCIIGAIGQSTLQTNYGNTEIKERNIVTESGFTQTMYTYIPENATPESKAPVVVVVHGGNDDKELMIRYALELARCGYVAVSIDMYGHGDSSYLPDSQWLTAGRGVYDTVREVVNWPFVDADNVSLMGYSRGAKACGEALELDNEELNVVKNLYLLFSDPIYKNEEGFTDVYGQRNVAVLADLYDEFFFTEKADNTGVYSNDANRFMETLTSPVDYIETPSAQSFLHFGEDPEGLESRKAQTIYEKEFDGATATREINVIDTDHMAGHYLVACIQEMLDFFARVVPSPVGASQNASLVWGYDIFALVGMTGLLMFVVFLASLIAEKSNFFKEVMAAEPQIAKVTGKSNKIWHWIGVIVGVLFTIFVIWWLNIMKLSSWHDSLFRSARFVYIPLICVLGASFTLLVSTLTFHKNRKQDDSNQETQLDRILIGWKSAGKTILLALIVITVLYVFIFGVKYFMGVSYKFTLWGFQTFSAARVPYMILVAPMLTLFYIVTAINNDGLGYSNIFTSNKRLNGILTALISALPMAAVLIYFYGSFRITGWNPMFGGNASVGSSVYILPVTVFVMVILCRKIFERTGNIFLGGFIAGFITSIMTSSVCEIRIPEADEKFTVSWLILGLIIASYIIFVVCMKYFNKVKKKG